MKNKKVILEMTKKELGYLSLFESDSFKEEKELLDEVNKKIKEIGEFYKEREERRTKIKELQAIIDDIENR